MGGDSVTLISAHLVVSAGARCDDTRASEPFPTGFVTDGSADLDAALAVTLRDEKPCVHGPRSEVTIQALGRRPAEVSRSGLRRLSDRVAALGGRLEWDGPPGGRGRPRAAFL